MNSTRVDVRQTEEEQRAFYDVVFELRFEHERAREILTRTPFLQELIGIVRNVVDTCFQAAVQFIDQEEQPNVNILQQLPKYKRCGIQYEGHECIICTENMTSREFYRKLPCEHVFHKKCIDRWVVRNPTCPTCRFSLLNTQQQPAPEEN
jgi:hypothetical protein